PGAIDPAARALIDRARAAGWQAVTLPGRDGAPGVRVVHDGAGRYAYERRIGLGLRETVVCDGTTLLHLYPEIALAARRAGSRFRRAALAAVVPWVLPPADDLARGADLVLLDPSTVAVVPRRPQAGKDAAPPSVQMHLVFAADGRLAELRVVGFPSRQTFYRETYDAAGTVTAYDAAGKVLAEHRLARADAAAPDLRPDLADLV